MFITTITNFILSSLKAGTEVAGFVVFIRQTLIVNPNYPLSEKPELVINVLRGVVALGVWAANFPVSINLLRTDSVSIHAWWRYCSAISLSYGGLGPSSQIDSG